MGHVTSNARDINLHAKTLCERPILGNYGINDRPNVNSAQSEHQAPQFELFGIEDVIDEPDQTSAVRMCDCE